MVVCVVERRARSTPLNLHVTNMGMLFLLLMVTNAANVAFALDVVPCQILLVDKLDIIIGCIFMGSGVDFHPGVLSFMAACWI